ncbi:alginate lyase family protein [Edaphobacter albus]|uniref:alginate lyase family protein n=1 Tax=Edaphobacter sp. 4G125 TaxID=2763071 RepID=UPI00164439A5|nr:alginate lyase family protein [Edaphobacter sp. 4G125]QNI38125.1 alginate lyase family protein [Edaphobacter sp. 4G125]
METTRRLFCSQAAALLLSTRLPAQTPATGTPTHPNVALIDHDRILAAADRFLSQPPSPLTTLPAPNSPGSSRDYYSEPDGFSAHRDALLSLAHIVPALASAYVLTKDERYARQAVAHLRAWFVSPETSMKPSLEYAQVVPPAKAGRPEGLVEAVHLAEVAQSIPFLASSEAFSQEDQLTTITWFTGYLDWLNTSRTAGLARDSRDHNGSSWLLQAAACARLNLKDDRPLTTLRHQFRSSTIRAQISFDGSFPRELTTPDPYRNSLFNLDMLAGCCELLSTRFENVWGYELQDGPGIRVAVARMFPFIGHRGSWPYKADSAFFNALPLRRPALLLAARAYSRPEYADLWKTLPADTSIPELDRTFPIRQPLLWSTRSRS